MTRTSRVLSVITCSVALAACSASPYLPEKKFASAAEKRLMRMTGSRISQMVDPNDPIPATRSPLTVITRDQIDHYGARSVADLVSHYSFDYSGAGR